MALVEAVVSLLLPISLYREVVVVVLAVLAVTVLRVLQTLEAVVAVFMALSHILAVLAVLAMHELLIGHKEINNGMQPN
jgi:hypothetical protein